MVSVESILAGYNPWWSRPEARLPVRHRNRRESAFQQLKAAAGDNRSRSLVLRGPRRVGKSVLLHQLASWLLDEARIPPSRLLHVDLSDPLLDRSPGGPELLDAIHAAWPSGDAAGPRIALLDEIQSVPSWDRWLKNALDWKELRVVATGSSSMHLVRGGRESGRGRWDEETLEALTFREFLALQAAPDQSAESVLDLRPGALLDFLVFGGSPEHLGWSGSSFELHRRVREDVDRDLRVDLAGTVRDPESTSRLYRALAVDSGQNVGSQKLADALGLDRKTIASHVGHLVDMMLIERVAPASSAPGGAPRSLRKRLSDDRLFTRDHGHVSAFAGTEHPLAESHVAGRVFETAVLRALRAVEGVLGCREIGYFRADESHEIDFVLTLPDGQVGIEVTASGRADKKCASAARAADRFGVPALVVSGMNGRGESQGVPHVGLTEFLLDPVAALAEVRR
ncbi:MAG: AAA family ATPase [Planctomycetota bacterium]